MISIAHVLLIYPSCEKHNPNEDSDFAQNFRNIPIGILSVATYVRDQGYDVDILDCRRYKKQDIPGKLDEKMRKDTVCVGFSMMTMQTGHGLQLIDYVKSRHKAVVVVGGIHPTLFPQQTIDEPAVDFVVVGEGEHAFVALLRHLTTQSPAIGDVPGLGYKRDGKGVLNPIGAPLDVTGIPFPDYDLLDDIEIYIARKFYRADGSYFKMRSLDLHTSRGCPYQCTFCINTLPYFKKWRSKPIEEILAHIDHVIRKYKLDFLWFMDDFFFGNIQRVRQIAQHLIDKKHQVRWESTIRANIVHNGVVNDEVFDLIKRSGCYSLGFGFESGSDRILKKIKKFITVEDIVFSVQKCKEYGIMPRGSFICGYPTETKAEVKMTGKLILHLKEIYPEGIYYSPGLLRPYPGAELYEECLTYGFAEPKSMREWGEKRFDFGLYMSPKDLKWVKHPDWLRSYQIYLHLASLRLTAKLLKKKQSLPYAIFGEISLWRIRHDALGFAFEPPLLTTARRVLKIGA